MIVHPSRLKGVFIVASTLHHDFRGTFLESYNARAFETAGIPIRVDQANVSESLLKGTVRGMHWQAPPHGQKKFVRALRGAAFDVAVDVRPESNTYGDWVAARLEPESGIALYIPEGFAHGWQALEDRSAIEYLVEGYWDRASERGVSPLNRRVDIQWPLKPTDILDRDLSWPALS